MHSQDIMHQLVPPHKCQTNMAERAIHTFKNHFKSCLALVDPEFPMAQWDLLLDQACITLNLVRASRCNPMISAYAYLKGNFDHNSTPIATPGTRVIAHSKPAIRKI